MNLHSLLEIKNKVIELVQISPMGSLIGISAPKYSGKRYLSNLLYDVLSSRAGRFFFNFKASDFLNDDFISRVKIELRKEFEVIDNPDHENLAIGDSLYYLFSELNNPKSSKFIFFIENLEEISVDQQYFLLGQLRNIREKAKTEQQAPCFHFIVFGEFSFEKLRQKSKLNIGSIIFDNFYSINSLSREDINQLFDNYSQQNSFTNIGLYKDYLYELSKGCFGNIDNVLSSVPLKEMSCAQISSSLKNFSSSQDFIDQLKLKFSVLAEDHKMQLKRLLQGLYYRVKEDEPSLEDLYLSGFIKINKLNGVQFIEIRSWAHELALRSHPKSFFNDKEIFKNISEIIPPSFALNKEAYELVMKIENLLRNLLTFTLAKRSYMQHPFENLKLIDKKKELRDGRKVDYYNLAKNEKIRITDINLVQSHSALASYLDLNDLGELFLDETLNGKVKGIYFDLNQIFPNKTELSDLFKKLKNIRNPVAHNNLITEATITDLQDIYKKILSRLSEPC